MDRFDYVIVGAGSAGCVLAARLSEDPGTTVLLLEAGGRGRHPFVHIPAAFPRLFGSRLDWAYETVPQARLGGRTIAWPRGRLLGGSSSINAMMWLRGAPADYDALADLAGPSWSFSSVLPYFLRAERHAGGGDELAGGAGPVPIGPLRDPNPLTGRFLSAASQVAIAPARPNGHRLEGATETPVTQQGGRRVSAADAYLKPVAHRPNLVIRTGAAVHKVLFEGRVATGVSFRAGREEQVALASREVLLSAGAIGSPQLLLCSGVGPGPDLSALSIEVVADAPQVGAGLEDHLASGIAVGTAEPVTLAAATSLRSLVRYLLGRRGLLTSNIAEAVAFVRSDPSLDEPDLELVFLPVPFLDEGRTLPTRHGVTLAAVLLQPRSAGSVSLTHPDAAVPPRIDPGYLTDPDGADERVLSEGVRLCQKILATAPLAESLEAPLAPAAIGEAAVATAVRDLSQTLYHPVGTCKMGTGSAGVLDATCKVRGVGNLRVVDASVMPRIIRGHTHAPTVMIAEKVADLLRGRPPG